MLIATWNVNDVNRRLPVLLAWLDAAQPDVVALQELKSTAERYPRDALDRAGYGSAVVGQRSWNGVALLARGAEPVVVRRALPGDAGDSQARWVEAAIGGVLFASLYLPNGNPWPGPKFDYKMAWFDRLLAHAAELAGTGAPVALLGDYNVVPTDADIYSPASWRNNALLQPEPRAAYARLVAQGWTDALRQRHPADRVYTFWDRRRNRWPRDAGLRIDHVLLSRSLAPRLVDAGVHRELRGVADASDHAPVWARLADASPAGRRSPAGKPIAAARP